MLKQRCGIWTGKKRFSETKKSSVKALYQVLVLCWRRSRVHSGEMTGVAFRITARVTPFSATNTALRGLRIKRDLNCVCWCTRTSIRTASSQWISTTSMRAGSLRRGLLLNKEICCTKEPCPLISSHRYPLELVRITKWSLIFRRSPRRRKPEWRIG